MFSGKSSLKSGSNDPGKTVDFTPTPASGDVEFHDEDYPFTRFCQTIVDVLCDYTIFLLAHAYTTVINVFPRNVFDMLPFPFNYHPGELIVKIAFLVRISQTLFKIFFLPFGIAYQVPHMIGLLFVIQRQLVLCFRELMRLLGFGDPPELIQLADTGMTRPTVKKALLAMKYARAAYGDGPTSLMFAQHPPKYPTSLLSSVLDFFQFLLDSINHRFHEILFEYKIPDVWMLNCDFIRLYETRSGFATYADDDGETQYVPIFTPLSALYVDHTADDQGDVLVLVIRGSTTMEDWLTDLNCDPAVIKDFRILGLEDDRFWKYQRDCKVHVGIFAAAADIAAQACDDIVREATERNIRKVFITGHSLGGGVTVYLTDLFQRWFQRIDQIQVVHGYAFAPPGSFEPRQRVQNLESFMYEDDIVPRLSLGSIMAVYRSITNDALRSMGKKEIGPTRAEVEYTLKLPEGVHGLKHHDYKGSFGPMDPFKISLLEGIKCHFPWFYDDVLRKTHCISEAL